MVLVKIWLAAFRFSELLVVKGQPFRTHGPYLRVDGPGQFWLRAMSVCLAARHKWLQATGAFASRQQNLDQLQGGVTDNGSNSPGLKLPRRVQESVD